MIQVLFRSYQLATTDRKGNKIETTSRITIDTRLIEQLITRAARNKGKKAHQGAVTVTTEIKGAK